MKYFALAALLGAASAITLYDLDGNVAYVQLDAEDCDEKIDLSGTFFTAGQHEQLGAGAYERVLPVHFTADSDDLFMRSMYEQYALEAKTRCGAPSGHFWMNEATTRAAAAEVLNTHKGLSGDALDNYLNTYFAKAWGHFDVNRTGLVEVIKMPQFMRFLASDQYMSLQP